MIGDFYVDKQQSNPIYEEQCWHALPSYIGKIKKYVGG